jgi:hypothetical protein
MVVLTRKDDRYAGRSARQAANWTYYHRLLTGATTSAEDTSSVQARGKLALQLYRETARLLWPTLNEERRPVVEQALRLIQQAL